MVAVVLAVFSINNWDTYVPVKLWADLEPLFRLPVLVISSILLGLLPYFLIHRATRWSLKRKLDRAEQALASTRTAPVITAPTRDFMPPSATPMAVPPGVS
jgi:uncharacterized protein (DUF2062 family)